MGRSRAVVVGALSVVLSVLLSGVLPATALAQPPDPPPNPSDDDLRRSHDTIAQRADEVGRLTAQLADIDSRTDDIQAELAAQREDAEAALVEFQGARAAADAAAARATQARQETEAATAAIDAARARVDEIVVSSYLQGLDLGPLGLLTQAASPEDLVARAEADDVVARNLLAVAEELERARVAKANADSTARALLDEARARESAAAAAKSAADGAVARAQEAARAQAARLAAVDAERAAVQGRLDAATNADATLRAQRDRFLAYQAKLAAEEAARDRAAAAAAAGRVKAAGAAGGGGIQRVIDRAMSQLGVQYVWGGGTGRGPSTGIPGPAGDPGNRIGFDCSGLMLYAFNGAGVSLPRVSRNQFDAGRKVPISDLRPGDMVFYRNGGAPIHHVAMYVGGGKMIEAPYTGGNVRITPLRRKGLLAEATRMF
ncbi:MAG: C40 family peptidase [Pseudonocardia sp.]